MVRGVAVCLLLLFAVPQLGPLRVTRHVAVGVSHTAVVTPDGSVWVWGDNRDGQLGDGTRQAARTPVKLAALRDVIAVAAGGRHTLVLRANGDVWGWGALRSEEPSQLLPILVTGLPQVVAVAAGDHHALALGDDGAVYAWGDNDVGQLADETTVAALMPVRLTIARGRHEHFGRGGVNNGDASGWPQAAVGFSGPARSWGAWPLRECSVA